ncbi:MAG: integral rane sensor signal transduction histidine kinase [Planctomycetaceae bacterium]|nr:integral rane sensor signal transduction histidine kinase [Planctomycetaceae bacterium]
MTSERSKMTGDFIVDRWTRLRGGRGLSRTINVVVLLVVITLDWLSNGAATPFLALPVALSALREGWRGGLATAVLCSIAISTVQGAASVGSFMVTSTALVCLSLLVGIVFDRERTRRRHFQETNAKLSSVYEKVQANFEGMKRIERLSALGQLSAGLAHEIRNPLASISGAASILRRNEKLDLKHARCIEIITNECHRLNGLLTNFLEFARPPAPHFETIDLDTVLDSVLALANHGIRGKMVHCEKQTERNLPRLEGDPEQLEQVLLNLMINAIEASPNGATVILSAEAEDGKIVLRVTDRGDGVPPAHIDRLFDPFFTTKEHGTGLGLPVAHQIITQMGGTIVAQRGSGKGMMFSVVLPAKHRDG